MSAKRSRPLKVVILTLFPELIEPSFNHSILKRAQHNGLLDTTVIDIRNYARNKHASVDDKPYGGGAGMVMQVGPVARALRSVKQQPKGKVYLLSPTGKRFNQKMAKQLCRERQFTLICGHYEGFDQRIHDHFVDDEISIGDFVLTGGEPAAVVIVDAVTRLIPGVLGDRASAEQDSFADGLLDYPHYTRPVKYGHWKVPDILLTGHHKKVEKWRREQQLQRTLEKRPDLLEKVKLNKDDQQVIDRLKSVQSISKRKSRRMR